MFAGKVMCGVRSETSGQGWPSNTVAQGAVVFTSPPMPDTRRPDLRSASAESVLRAANRTGNPARRARGDGSTQRAHAHDRYLHLEGSKTPAV